MIDFDTIFYYLKMKVILKNSINIMIQIIYIIQHLSINQIFYCHITSTSMI